MFGASIVAIHSHGSVAMECVIGTGRFIYRNLIMVYSKPVSLCITIGEQSTLKHFIRRKTYSRNYVGWVKGSLFHILKIIFRISVQFKFSYRDKGEILFRPDLG